MSTRNKIYLGRKNPIVKTLARDGVVINQDDRDAITKVQVIIQGECFNTADHPTEITYDSTTGKFTLIAGLREGLTAADKATATVNVYDADHPTYGLAWGYFTVDIYDWPTCAA
jgi:hypothetical protein